MSTKTAHRPAPAVDDLRHYTPEEAVDVFNLPVSARTLREWAYARKVPHNGMGGRITFTAADIRAANELFAVPAVANARAKTA